MLLYPEDLTPLWPEELDDEGWIRIGLEESTAKFTAGSSACGAMDDAKRWYCTRQAEHMGCHVAATYNYPNCQALYIIHWPK